MKLICAVACLIWSCGASASSNWLTIMGNPLDPAVATIEIDPTQLSPQGERRTMMLRVSRPQQRISTDGVAFRSYLANVEFDCVQRNARFISVDFYELSGWQGKPHKSMAYGPAQIRPLAFRYFEPNPLEKLVQAACPNANAPKN